MSLRKIPMIARDVFRSLAHDLDFLDDEILYRFIRQKFLVG